MRRLLLLAVATALLAPAHALAATYYVKTGGNDAASGTSIADAWSTVDPVNDRTFAPGDRILFEGGQTFAGPLWPPSSGAPGAPITYSSFGTGRATIASTDGNVVWLHGRSYVTLD